MNTVTKHLTLVAATLLLFGGPAAAQDRAADDGAADQPAPYEVRLVEAPDVLADEVDGAVPSLARRPESPSLGHTEGEATPALPRYQALLIDLPEASASELPSGMPAPAERPGSPTLGHAEGGVTPALPRYQVRLVEVPEVPAHEVGTAPSAPAPGSAPMPRRAASDQ